MIVPDIGQLRTNSRINQYSTGRFFRDEPGRPEAYPNEESTDMPDGINPVWYEGAYPKTIPAPANQVIPFPDDDSRLLRSDWTVSGLEEGEALPPLIGIGIGLVIAAMSFPGRGKTAMGTLGFTVGGILVGLNAVEFVKKVAD